MANDPNVTDPEDRAKERLEAARTILAKREAELEAAKVEKANAGKLDEFGLYVSSAVSDAVTSVGVMIPAAGLWLHVTASEAGNPPAVSVLKSPPRATRAAGGGRKPKASAGNGERLSISALGITEFVLPDGNTVKSPQALLDTFKAPYYGKGGGDQPSRQIYRWIKDNPAIAAEILVKMADGSTPTLIEAVEAQGFTVEATAATPAAKS